jgi:hypothetical protein
VALRCLLDAGSYSLAERVAATWTESIRKDKGTDSLEESQAADYLVEARVKMGRSGLPASLDLAESVVRAKERYLGPTDPDLATSLENLASSSQRCGEFSAATQLHRRALSLQEARWRRRS